MPSESLLMIISLDAERSTTPAFLATTHTPESTAALFSIPVPTTGASVDNSGTAWRCMLEPISARFASSFSRNGIMDVATENTIFGETSIKSMAFFWNAEVSSLKRPETLLLMKWPSASNGSFACATTKLSSSSAVRYTTLSVTTGFNESDLSRTR